MKYKENPLCPVCVADIFIYIQEEHIEQNKGFIYEKRGLNNVTCSN